MSLRKLIEKEILIRLNEDGFVETVRRFGRERSLVHTLEPGDCSQEVANDQPVILVNRKRRESAGSV
jgi:hypothetical protein